MDLDISSPELTLEFDAEGNHLHLKVFPVHGSATVRAIQSRSGLPIAHVAVTPFAATGTLADDFSHSSISIADFIQAVEGRCADIAAHFLPNLPFDMADWCYEVYRNRSNMPFITPELYLLIGHQKLFAHSHTIRSSANLLVQQEVLLTSVHMHWRKKLRNGND